MIKDFSLYDFLIYLFLPFGQLLARINVLNNSLDKPWLIIFCFIPFLLIPILSKFSIYIDLLYFIMLTLLTNIIPLLLIEFNIIKMNDNDSTSDNNTNYIDKYIILPIIMKILTGLLLIIIGNNFINDQLKKFIINMIIISTIIFSLIYKNNNINKLTLKELIIIFFETFFIYAMSDLSVDVFNVIKYNTINIPNDNFELNNLLDSGFSVIGLFISYIFINFYNNYYKNINNNCLNNLYFNNIHVFITMISIFYYYIKYFSNYV